MGDSLAEATSGTEVFALLEEVWRSVDDLASGLDEADWKTPTALPGWSVQDCVSHIIGSEASLLGDPQPEAQVAHLPHVADNPFAQLIEVPIEARRSRSGAEVLAEYRDVITRRLEALRAMDPAELEVVGWSPVGEVPYREFLHVRVFDCWMHEQDMRRALDRPGHLTGPVVALSLGRIRAALGFVVGKKAAAPQGSVVVFDVTGPTAFTWAVVVDGRAAVTDEIPPDPTVTIQLPLEALAALGGGRWTGDEAEAAGGLTVEGDAALGRRVLANMAFTP